MIRQILKGVAVSAAVMVGGGLFAAWQYQQQLKIPLSNQQATEFTVLAGDNLGRVSKRLQQQGLLQPSWAHKWLLLFQPALGQFKVGTYEVVPSLTAPSLFALLASGKEKQFSVTLIEGETLRQWLTRLGQHERLNWADQAVSKYGENNGVTENTDPSPQFSYPPQVMDGLAQRLKPEAPGFEGMLFPDTYYFTAGSTGEAVLERAYRQMNAVLQSEWQQRHPGLPLNTPYEALILASIIEKETGVADERPIIGSVFINRLNKKMRLQTDPTVIYGLGEEFDGDITRAHLRQKTPYNTYRINGLPPTPIAMPGRESIRAALQPATTDYLYFVSRGDGSHIFSTNLADHNRAVYQYQKKRS